MFSAWDTQLLVTINVRLHHQLAWVWMDLVTQVGDYRVVLLVAAIAGALAWHRRRWVVPIGFVGLVVALQVTGFLKGWIDRPRPAQQILYLYVVPEERGHAFPSGHTTAAFALAACLHRWWPGGRMTWWAMAAIVAWSRVYLGLHYPSDCVAGALVGAGIVWVALKTGNSVSGTFGARHLIRRESSDEA